MKIGDTIIMPEPFELGDSWEHGGFSAIIKSVDDELVIVEDADGDCFSIERYRIDE